MVAHSFPRCQEKAASGWGGLGSLQGDFATSSVRSAGAVMLHPALPVADWRPATQPCSTLEFLYPAVELGRVRPVCLNSASWPDSPPRGG